MMHARLAMKTQLRVAPQQVMASTLLQTTITDLERYIEQALIENPALERVEALAFGSRDDPLTVAWDVPLTRPTDVDPFSADDADPTEQLIATISPLDHLRSQVTLLADPPDLTLALNLLDSLDHHGYLRSGLTELAQEYGVTVTAIERALHLIQTCDPPGIGAGDLRECLLLQCTHLANEGIECRLAYRILDEAWPEFTAQQWARVARRLQVPYCQIVDAQQFIRQRLYPYPMALLADQAPSAQRWARADLVIQPKIEAGRTVYSVAIPQRHDYQLQINHVFAESLCAASSSKSVQSSGEYIWLHAHVEQARQFIAALQQRWSTLQRIGDFLVVQQFDFLEQGVRSLKPLTQAKLAAAVGIHESTASRAIQGKHVQLPNGRLWPLANFFDHSLPAKEALRQLLHRTPRPLSDCQIAEHLRAEGFDLARRTVAKYREQLNISPHMQRLLEG